MVLEHLFPEDWLERKLRYAFILAVVYSTIAIVVARLLFAANSGIVSVVFVSLLLIPYMDKLLAKDERAELGERSVTFSHFWRDNKRAISVYLVLFFGIYLTYTVYSFLLPQLGFDVGSVFREQLALELNLRGAAFSGGTFLAIFLNNWWVLLACFVLALIAGDGALFFVAWNASSWGTIFGFRALEAAIHGGAYGALPNLLIILVITLPHVVLEGGAYILAAIAGGVLSDDVISKRSAMGKFIYYLLSATLLFLIFLYLFHAVFSPLVARLLDIGGILLLLYALSYVFDDKRHEEIFRYNYWLFLVAIALFLLGAIVETFVVGNSGLLQQVYWAAIV